MFNVGIALANPSFQVHALVLSRKHALTWLAATGQPSNSNFHIFAISSGEYEDWQPTSPRDLVSVVQSSKFTASINTAINTVKTEHPDDTCTVIIANVLMYTLPALAASLKLKIYLLAPGPCYMLQTADTQNESSVPTDEITLHGIGGSPQPLTVQLGDIIDLMGPMYKQMAKSTLNAANGQIWSNTNTGLEGGVHAPEGKKDFFVGPILPATYESALDDDKTLAKQRTLADRTNECIKFLDTRSPREVVYVALGSHVHLSVTQALAIINELRKYKVPWLLLFREGKDKLEEALGDRHHRTDGLITTWAPQLDVLMHPATKCVLSHGGFGTMIEGVYAGQPFITSPVVSDQFLDTKVMLHLGICVGTIAINTLEGVMTRTDLEPRWPDDCGRLLQEVFRRAFGEGGEEVLERARVASKALRARMLKEERTSGLKALNEFRAEVSEGRFE